MSQRPVDGSTRKVLEAIARHLGVDVGRLRSRDRTKSVVGARWAAWVVLHRRCGLSYRQLGAMMHRDPKAAWFAIDLARDSPGIRDLAEFVERQIDQESSRTQRAIVDVEAAFRRAREDAGAPPANSTRKRPL